MSTAVKTKQDLDRKVNAWKDHNKDLTPGQVAILATFSDTPQGKALTEAINSAVDKALDSFQPTVADLSRRLKHAHSRLKRQETAMSALLKSVSEYMKVKERPQLPTGYAMPQVIKTALDRADDATAEALKHLRADIADFQRREAQAQAEKQAAAKERSDYLQAVSGNYATATAAIAQRKGKVAQTGTVFTYGLGAEVKGLFNPRDLTLFAFDPIPSDTLEHDGQQYRILSVAPVIQGGAAGYVYRLQYAGSRPLFGRQ
ncbi:MAG: hypothetical protein AB7T17_01930 [Geobacter sp.]